MTVAVLLDAGCGDCKYICKHLADSAANPAARNFILGQDNCREMLTMRKYPNSDACHLVQDTITHLSLRWPFNGRFMNRPGCVDGVLCVSVLQHLPNKYRQLEAIENLIRVCHPGSRVLLYVWSFEKEGMEPRLGEKTRQDHFVSWKIADKDGRERTVDRFFYLFVNGELEYLLSFFSHIRLVQRAFDGKNWCVEFEVLCCVCATNNGMRQGSKVTAPINECIPFPRTSQRSAQQSGGTPASPPHTPSRGAR